MIEMKTKPDRNGIGIEMTINGKGEDILVEAFMMIGSIIANIKNTSEEMYADLMVLLSHHPEVFKGEINKDEEEAAEAEMANAMSKGILKGGMN